MTNALRDLGSNPSPPVQKQHGYRLGSLFITLSLSVPIHTMGIVTIPAKQGSWEDVANANDISRVPVKWS